MERLKKARTPTRASFTTLANAIRKEMAKPEPDLEALEIKIKLLEAAYEKIQALDNQIIEAMLDESASEEALVQEYETIDKYSYDWVSINVPVAKLINKAPASKQDGSSVAESSTFQDVLNNDKKRNFRLPKIELRKFSGNLKDWLGFWAQFKKIDEDGSLHASDKFHYLLQSMEDDTEAKELVNSYPASAENYPKVIEALKERFGNEGLLLQVYIRELLSLIIQNATKKEPLPLERMYLKLESHLRALETLNLATADPATWLFPLVESSLPEDTLRAWQRSPLSKMDGKKENPPKTCLDLMMEFIKSEVKSEQRINLARAGFGEAEQSSKPVKKNVHVKTEKLKFSSENVSTSAGLFNSSTSKCVFCGKQHETKECGRAEYLSLEDKKTKIKEKKACFTCLKTGHSSKICKAFVKCIVCSSKKHLTVMCPELHSKRSNQTKPGNVEGSCGGQSSVKSNENSSTHANNANFDCSGEILLKTVMAFVSKGNSEERRLVRVLFDDGSQRSYITSAIINQIKSKAIDQELSRNVLFDGTVTAYETVNKHQVVLCSVNGENRMSLVVREKKTIGGNIPKIPSGPWIRQLKDKGIALSDHNQNVKLTDIDLVIGSEHWGRLMTGKMEKLSSGLTATESLLGWTLSGPVPQHKQTAAKQSISMFLAEENLSKLWNLELIGITDPSDKLTKVQEEEAAKEIFMKKVSRDGEGRYSVGLPWINGEQEIPSNRNCAERRLMSTTQKLNVKGQFNTYDKIFKSWLDEGFIEECSYDESTQKCHYLPHHPVFKESLTTPVRPVFDASCKIGRHPSLNDCLYKGPNCIEELVSVLMRFRLKKVGGLADIRKAFQMIDVEREDRNYLRFLWWKDPEQKEIITFRHKCVVFGLNCSPYLLGAVLNLHLKNVAENQKIVAQLLQKALYVDNCVVSLDSHEEFVKFKEVSTEIMSQAKMELRQWECTLVEESRVGSPSGECGLETGKMCISSKALTKVLGMIWDKTDDTLSIDIKARELPERLTKRTIASVLHQVFDPVGYSCPALLQPKIILQQAWKNEIHWDKELPEEWEHQFRKWCQESHVLKEIKIPRMCRIDGESKLELHTFTDASQDAYGAVVYLRSERENKVKVQLLQAKCRVSPINKPTIPRLELLGCLIGSRLAAAVKESLELGEITNYFWSDSTTAISWIQRNDEWGTFVGNQVKKILNVTKSNQWRHVPGYMNPADLPSRGCSPQQLIDSRWWEGPEWLYKTEDKWPVNRYEVNEEEIIREKRKTATTMKATTDIGWYVPKFSSFLKNVKVIGWIRRFYENTRKNPDNRDKSKYLSISEINQAELDIIRFIQVDLKEDMPKLPIVKKEDGILYLKTAIMNRKDTEQFKSPILLPKSHPLVEQLIRETHRIHCHGGIQFLMGKLRERFWITQARKTITNVIRKCVICRRFSSKSLEVAPAALPEKRVTCGEVFDTTGVDLAGPLQLKNKQKGWIVLYTCAVYRAVHLDVVESLSTESFMKSLQRFIHQYGRPHTLYSDNGTNFVGANNLFKNLDFKKIEMESNAKRINWIFNPPTGSWWGGWWERLVKTVKGLLRRMIGKSNLTLEELQTCLTAVASTINDRPLTTVTEDPEDLTPLTPAMFLRGTKNLTFPEGGMISSKDFQESYKRIGALQQSLQNRFRREYLAQLVQRAKGRMPSQIAVGHIVLVGADNKKRFEWPLGRVVEVIPGRDGEVRVAKVRTQTGFLIRPLQRLYPLEISNNEDKPVVPETELAKPIEMEVLPEEPYGITRSGRKIQKPCRYGSWNT